MADLQEELARTSAVARLDEIIRVLRSSQRIESPQREWFEELLVPFALSTTQQCLTSSFRKQRPRRDALLTVLMERVEQHSGTFELLTELYTKLHSNEPLEGELGTFARDLAFDLRSCLLRSSHNDAPRVDRFKRAGSTV
jgi:hypothetical protein